ncbi:hypothetical protein [Psychromonas aquimarina]|uniref:hypothetical protein n=1 Tax=Psychromonas aquimarina TaxID=444919 RepID=UPI00048B6B93|nr:hypothetical protein [Psychromonas aquimarina]
MSRKLAVLLLLVISVNVNASQSYDLAATMKHNDKTLFSPQLKIVDGRWQQVRNDSCTYSSQILEQADNTLLVESDIACGDFVLQSVFILNPEGGEAKLEIGEVDDMWEFRVSVSVQH